MVNPYDPAPAYVQIADAIRKDIGRGVLKDGDQIPSVRELAAKYGTAPGTVRQAQDQLKAEGLIIARQGTGSFVRRPQRLQRIGSARHLRSRRPPGAPPLEAEAAEQGIRRGSDLIEVSRIAATAEVAEKLHVAAGSDVVVRRYLLTLNDEPAQTADSYFTHATADGTLLTEPASIPGGTHAYLADQLGIELVEAVEDLVARMPTPQEIATLHLSPGTPVVELVRTIYTTDVVPVEVTIFRFAADRHSFTYVVPMD